jgi:MYXO-CTERM domain-containing protein
MGRLYWRLFLAIFLCFFSESLIAQSAESRDYPLLLEGRGDFFYHLLTEDAEVYEDAYGGIFGKNPVFGQDGSALYEGYRLGASDSRVTLSFQQLLEGRLLRNVFPRQPQLESAWMDQSLRVRADLSLMKAMMSALEENPETFLSKMSSMTDSTAGVLGQILFGDQLRLTGEDLQDFRRSAEEPLPSPTQFDLSLPWKSVKNIRSGDRENPPSGFFSNLKGQLTDRVMDRLIEIVLSIQIEAIQFDIVARRVVFDPETNWVLLELWLDEFEFNGEILNEVDLVFPASFRVGDKVREKFGIGPSQQRLKRGTISGGVFLSVNFHLKREEEEGFWVLETAPNTTPRIDFIPPPISEEEEMDRAWIVTSDAPVDAALRSGTDSGWTPLVTLEMESLSPQGQWVPDPKPIPYPLEGMLLADIMNNFRAVVTPALQFRSLMDQWGWANQRFFEAEDGKKQAWGARTRLGDFLVHPDGLEFLFDMRLEVDQIAGCLSHLSPSWKSEAQELVPQESDPASRSELWAMIWHRTAEEKWQLGKVLRTSSPEDQVTVSPRQRFEPYQEAAEGQWSLRLSEDLLNGVLEAGFWAGELCRSTRQIWPRLASIPLIVVTPEGAPQIDLRNEGEAAIEFPFSLQSFARDEEDIFQSFKVGQLSRSFLLRGNLQLDSPQSDLRFFTDLQPLNGPSLDHRMDFEDLGPGESESLLRVILVMGRQVGLIPSSSLNLEWPISVRWEDYLATVNSAQDWFKVESVELGSEDLAMHFSADATRLADLPSKPPLKMRELVEEPSRRRPLTQLQSRPDYRVFEDRVRFSWNQQDPEQEALYSYRVWSPANEGEEPRWGAWSPFQSENELVLRLSKPGLYHFQVVAMSSQFDIESRVNAEASFYYEGSANLRDIPDLSWDENSENTWTEPEAPDDEAEKEEPIAGEPHSKEPAPRESSAELKKEANRGFFGCVLNVEAGRSEGLWFWALLVLLMLGLYRRREARFF